mgnify:FL=1
MKNITKAILFLMFASFASAQCEQIKEEVVNKVEVKKTKKELLLNRLNHIKEAGSQKASNLKKWVKNNPKKSAVLALVALDVVASNIHLSYDLKSDDYKQAAADYSEFPFLLKIAFRGIYSVAYPYFLVKHVLVNRHITGN